MEKWCGQKKLSDINLVGVCIQTMKYFTGSGHISKVWLNFSNECRFVFCRYSFWWLSFVGKVFWLFLFAEICSRQNIYLYDSWKPLVDVSHGRPIFTNTTELLSLDQKITLTGIYTDSNQTAFLFLLDFLSHTTRKGSVPVDISLSNYPFESWLKWLNWHKWLGLDWKSYLPASFCFC